MKLSVYITSISQLFKYVFVFWTFFSKKTIWIWANCPTNTKTALCFANIETGLIVYKEIHVYTVYVKSS